jgi:cytochrome P450
VFQQEEKAFQIWYPESFMRILGDDNILSSVGSVHKHLRNLVLRVFGPENLRLVLFHDVQGAVKRSLASWLERPSIELKSAASTVRIFCFIFICAVCCHESTIFISPDCVFYACR